MSKNLRVSLAAGVALVVAVLAALALTGRDDKATSSAKTGSEASATPDGAGSDAQTHDAAAEQSKTDDPATDKSKSDGPQVVRKNSHRLDDAGPEAPTLVEFLDFECEACGAMFPIIEQLRKKYKGKINFVFRYFPTGHKNGELAARVVEAASRQGKTEAMYERMFETQKEWAEAQVSRRDVFDGFAKDLGLDMKQFKADVDAPEVAKRVKQDSEEGIALGVQGTPSFFLNGEALRPQTVEEFDAAVADAIAGK